jgi:imidazolonepropionase-like amidohydrolase
MRNVIYIFCVFLIASTISFGQEITYLYCGNVLDVDKGIFLQEQTIIIESNKIRSIEPGYSTPEDGAKLVNLRDSYVMPGLMDMHVHIESETNPKAYMRRFVKNEADIAYDAAVYAKRTLLAGFTTVRDLGGTGVNIALRDAIYRGKVPGPRIYTSGKAIGTTGGHADPTNGMKRTLMGDPGPTEGVVNGPAEAAQAVRQRYKNGADVIKITATGGVLSVAKDGKRPQFLQEELNAIIETAADYDMTTAAHAHGAEGMKRAVIAGITSIEHGTMMTEEVMDLMIEHGTVYVPTITAGIAVAEFATVPGYFPAMIVPKAKEIGPQIKTTFGKAYKHGVKIVFGTDAGVFYHGENAREFMYMHDEGMPVIECIQAATKAAAEMLHIYDKVGSLASGKFADIVAVKSDPTDDPAVLQHIDFIMKNGIIYKVRGMEQPY